MFVATTAGDRLQLQLWSGKVVKKNRWQLLSSCFLSFLLFQSTNHIWEVLGRLRKLGIETTPKPSLVFLVLKSCQTEPETKKFKIRSPHKIRNVLHLTYTAVLLQTWNFSIFVLLPFWEKKKKGSRGCYLSGEKKHISLEMQLSYSAASLLLFYLSQVTCGKVPSGKRSEWRAGCWWSHAAAWSNRGKSQPILI